MLVFLHGGWAEMPVLCGLTFELSGRRRQDARPGLAKKCTAYRQTGPGGLPLALRLSEGLGRTLARLR